MPWKTMKVDKLLLLPERRPELNQKDTHKGTPAGQTGVFMFGFERSKNWIRRT
jgi:hypothetical protein